MKMQEKRIELRNLMTLQSGFFVVNFVVRRMLAKRMVVDMMMKWRDVVDVDVVVEQSTAVVVERIPDRKVVVMRKVFSVSVVLVRR